MRVIKCARCGEDVFTTGPRTKYCLACATQIRIENQKKRRSGGLKDGAPHTKHITCEICGKDVVVPSKAARAKYCPECAAKTFKASTKKHRTKEKRWMLAEPRIIKCERCGVVLEKRRSNQKYCDDCRAIARNEQEAEKRRRQREGWRTGELPEKKKKKPRVSQIENLNAAARKAGMSYGKYVAMLAMKKGKKVRA